MDEHEDYIKPPSITLDNNDPSVIDKSVRSFIDAENVKAATLFAQIADAKDEREQLQRYTDSMLVVYRAGYLAAEAMLEARSVQVAALRDYNEKAHRSLSKAHKDLASSRSQLQRQRAATVKPLDDVSAPIVIKVDASKPGSKRVERDSSGQITRVVDEASA